jgi:DNA-binding CsgD family transcriptional regulator
MRANVVSLVEAAYLRNDDLQKWLENLVRVADAALSGGRGVFGIVIENEGDTTEAGVGTIDDPGKSPTGDNFANRAKIHATSYSGLPDRILETAAPLFEFTPNETVRQQYVTGGPVGTLSSVFAKVRGFDKRLMATGVADAVYLRASDASGIELVLAIPGERPIRIPAARRLLLSYVASHVKTAYRLRAKCSDALSNDDVEAIMSPDGKIEHARGGALEGDSREVLRAAALACLRAKSRTVDAEAALAEWRALFHGRWSVVDHADTDGKMFVVARRNEPKTPQIKGLNARENLVAALAARGYSNKEIQYELGWPLSTVASCLTSAIFKLGVSSRTALVRVLSSGRRS